MLALASSEPRYREVCYHLSHSDLTQIGEKCDQFKPGNLKKTAAGQGPVLALVTLLVSLRNTLQVKGILITNTKVSYSYQNLSKPRSMELKSVPRLWRTRKEQSSCSVCSNGRQRPTRTTGRKFDSYFLCPRTLLPLFSGLGWKGLFHRKGPPTSYSSQFFASNAVRYY